MPSQPAWLYQGVREVWHCIVRYIYIFSVCKHSILSYNQKNVHKIPSLWRLFEILSLSSFSGKLYLCGGTCFTPGRRSQVPYENHLGAQVYNPKEDLWQELLCLEREITKKHVRVSRGNIIAVDGFLLLLDDDVGKAHQLYNPVSQTLTSLIQAHGHHWFAGWAVYQGQLVCTGGLEDGRSGMTDMVHVWDLTERQQGWSMMPPLPRAMSHHACLNMHLNLPRPGTENDSSPDSWPVARTVETDSEDDRLLSCVHASWIGFTSWENGHLDHLLKTPLCPSSTSPHLSPTAAVLHIYVCASWICFASWENAHLDHLLETPLCPPPLPPPPASPLQLLSYISMYVHLESVSHHEKMHTWTTSWRLPSAYSTPNPLK